VSQGVDAVVDGLGGQPRLLPRHAGRSDILRGEPGPVGRAVEGEPGAHLRPPLDVAGEMLHQLEVAPGIGLEGAALSGAPLATEREACGRLPVPDIPEVRADGESLLCGGATSRPSHSMPA
jgi:hypothetical protein